MRRRLHRRDRDGIRDLGGDARAGMTDYVAIINRFAADGVIGEMDCVYSSWATEAPAGFATGRSRRCSGSRLSRPRHQIGLARAHDRAR